MKKNFVGMDLKSALTSIKSMSLVCVLYQLK